MQDSTNVVQDSTNVVPDDALPTILQAHAPGTSFNDPPGAMWYKRKDDEGTGPMQQMLKHSESEGHTFRAACDYWGGNKGKDGKYSDTVVKMYASFPSAKDFLVGTLLCSETRFMYELIPQGSPCKLHLDVEWTTTIVVPHSVKQASEAEVAADGRLTALLKLVRDSCQVSLMLQLLSVFSPPTHTCLVFSMCWDDTPTQS